MLTAEPAAGAVALYEPLKKLARDSSDDVRLALAEVPWREGESRRLRGVLPWCLECFQ